MKTSAKSHFCYLIGFFSLNVLVLIVLVLLYRFDFLPPPPFAGSISFDEKICFVRSKKEEKINILALGSSMTLNNLHSATLKTHLPDSGFLNVAAWGMLIRQDYEFAKYLLNFFSPELLVICSDIEDFKFDRSPDVIFNKKITTYYLKSGDVFSTYLFLFSGNYLRSNISSIKKNRTHRHIYESLSFDPHGGVALSAGADFQRLESRWQGLVLNELEVDRRNYEALVKLAELCEQRGIRLLFALTPTRREIYEQRLSLFKGHEEKLRLLAAEHDFIYVDLEKAPRFGDELFADWSHLNEAGAKRFTEYLMTRYAETMDRP